ncbi:hypothetical protein F4775DRAFT_598715 [Biscogniauxia sp. FL1348]|nr:hypothetical protein F4775DRAFT_598715 [Biscogniauxia sp. FL1348]
MCTHTLIHPICQTCHRPITPPTPGTVVRISYCPRAWDRLRASRQQHWISMSSPPAGSAFLNTPPPSPSPSLDLEYPPSGHPKIGPTAHLACRYPPPTTTLSFPEDPNPDPPFELTAPHVPSCHRCEQNEQLHSRFSWDSRDLCLEADEWMVYSQAQPERYARMCAWVYPPTPPPAAPYGPEDLSRFRSGDGDGDGDGDEVGGDIMRGYDWAVNGVPMPGAGWRAVPRFWRMKEPSFEKRR